MIERIVSMDHPGVLGAFEWPHDLPDFGKHNLVYGWNGTGKTTISSVLRSLELRQPLAQGSVTLRIDGRDVKDTAFGAQNAHVRVFNRDFIRESVLAAGGAKPIYVVGPEAAEAQRKLEGLREERERLQTGLPSLLETAKGAKAALDKHCSERASKIKEKLGEGAARWYMLYDAPKYRACAEAMLAPAGHRPAPLTDAERAALDAQRLARAKERASQVLHSTPDIAALREQVARLLRETVVSETIEALRDDSELNAWAETGLSILHRREGHNCPFCDQPMPPQRIEALEKHFSEAYDRHMRSLAEKSEALRREARSAREVSLPDSADFLDDLVEEYTVARDALRQDLSEAARALDELVELLTLKAEQPFNAVPAPEWGGVPPAPEPTTLNAIVDRHNAACGRQAERAQEARERLEADLVAASLDRYRELLDAEEEARTQASEASETVATLGTDIAHLEAETRSHRIPAEDLERDLRAYLGHDELSVLVEDTGYRFWRGAEEAVGLSEGEQTAIALLYFLRSLRAVGFDEGRATVVLDDPVSSLDANSIHGAFGFIRARTKDVAQLFVLTHNFTFFRHVRNWFFPPSLKGKRREESARSLYMLHTSSTTVPRRARLGALDPLLRGYESEYHYLFSLVRRAAKAGPADALEQHYGLANAARRLLEAFLAFRRPGKAGNLHSALESVEPDGARRCRIYRFVNAASHGWSVGEPEHDLSTLSEAAAVCKDVMDLMAAVDEPHYREMEALCATGTTSTP